MKDLHSHILYGIDDGSKSIDESITLLKKLEESGITDLMLTPHYIENSKYNTNNNDKETIFQKLKAKAKKEKINIRLYLGNEVYITSNFIKLLKQEEIKTLNGSKYLLLEFPMSQIYNNTLEIINELVRRGYVPVLAHPERYKEFQKHPDVVDEYLRSGVLLQGNFTSLFGIYGKEAEKTLKYFIKNKWITFLGSDVHHDVKFNEKKLRRKLLKITKNKEYIEDLLNKNFNKVIENKDLGILR